jgi:hypothetical protein
MPVPAAAVALPLIEPVAVALEVLVADPLSEDIDPVAAALPDIAELGSAAIAPYAAQSGLGAVGQELYCL